MLYTASLSRVRRLFRTVPAFKALSMITFWFLNEYIACSQGVYKLETLFLDALQILWGDNQHKHIVFMYSKDTRMVEMVYY